MTADNFPHEKFRIQAGVRTIALVFALSFSLLTGWILDYFGIGLIRHIPNPMSPISTALMALLSLSVGLRFRYPGCQIILRASRAAAIAILALSLWLLCDGFSVLEHHVQQISTYMDAKGARILPKMGLATILFFFLTSSGFLLTSLPLMNRRRFVVFPLSLFIMSILASAVIFMGFMAGVTYWKFEILLFPSPFSLVSFFLLNICLLIKTGSDQNWFIAYPAGLALPSTHADRMAKWSLLGGMGALTALILSIGGLYLHYRQVHLRMDAGVRLATIADFKREQVTEWRSDRNDEIKFFFNSSLVDDLHIYLQTQSATSEIEPPKWVELIAGGDRYKHALLFDKAGRLVKTWLAEMPPPDSRLLENVNKVLNGAGIINSDLYLGDEGKTHYDILIPVHDPVEKNSGSLAAPVGVLALRIAPDEVLFNWIQILPVESPSVEVSMLRREGDEVLFLNELRHRPGTAMKLRESVDSPDRFAGLATKNDGVVVDGIDYRGIPVVGISRRIPDTSWSLAVKEDVSDVFTPLGNDLLATGAVIVLLLFGMGLGLGLIWHHKQREILQYALSNETRNRVLAERISLLARQVNDIVLLMSADWKIVEANQRAMEAYGYSIDVIRSLRLHDLLDAEGILQAERVRLFQGSPDGMTYQTMHIRADGSRFPAQVSMRTISIGGIAHHQIIVRDLSEQMKAEADLLASEEKYRVLFDNAGDAIFFLDADACFLAANKMACERYQYSEEELITKSIAVLYPPDEQRGINERLGKVFNTGFVQFETVHIRKDGTAFPVEVNSRRMIWLGQPALISVCRDISKRKEAENALRLSEARFRSYFEMPLIGIAITSSEKQWLEVNDHLCAMFGYPREELLGLTWTEMTYPDDLSLNIEKFDKLISGETDRYEMSKRFIRKDGQVIWVQLAVAAVRNLDRSLRYNVSTMMDITEIKQAEEALRNSEARFRHLIDSSPVPYLLHDRQGNIAYLNAEFTRTFGYDLSHIPDVSHWWPLAYPDPEYCQWAQNEWDKQMSIDYDEGAPFNPLEMNIRCLDGSQKIVMVGAIALLRAKEEMFLAVFFDVTDMRKVEEQRLSLERHFMQSQKLESLGALAGGIAHDFNNLLMAVLGNLEMAMLELPPSSQALSYLEDATQAGKRAAELTRQMLAYSGKGKFFVRDTNLSELIEDNAQLFQSVIPGNVVLRFDLDKFVDLVKVDASQIQQALLNLLTNAAEAISGDNGLVSIAVRNMECSPSVLSQSRLEMKPPPGKFVAIDVSDNGSGMDSATLERIFDPFFTTRFIGRGLGMSAVSGIVQGHHGALMIDSAPGKGTRIRVLLPASDARSRNEQSEIRSSGALQARRNPQRPAILFVDDEEQMLKTCSKMIERSGFVALTALSGEAALTVCREKWSEIAAVVLDLSMPGMDGVETLRHLRSIQPDIPVILCSGYDEETAVDKFQGEGLSGFLQKPFSMRSLMAMILDVTRASGPQ